MKPRTGIGFDAHPLVKGRPMIVGGVAVPSDRGPMGHSDGDVLTHAIIDAILGGAGLGDIGTHFPSGDESFKGIASTELLRATAKLLSEHGCRATYVDATVILERPVLKPYVDRIAGSIAGCLGLDRELVNVKATTTDGLGFTGRGEGMSALAAATVDAVECGPTHPEQAEAIA